MKYASFGQRFMASLTDFVVLLPLTFAYGWALSMGKVGAAVVMILVQFAFVVYSVWFHARSGQTIGKYATRIRVVRTTGERIGWREAWLRSSVDIVISLLAAAGTLSALAAIPEAQYDASPAQRQLALADHEPAWMAWVATAMTFWYWSEVLIVLTNQKRRALHDFIAGTVVVYEGWERAPIDAPKSSALNTDT